MASPARTPAERVPLSRERVLQAAMALADESGIESVTMRRLAQELGVEAMSLYHHVGSKDELLGGLVDMVVAEIELPGGGSDWKEAIRRTAISAHETFQRHPWAAAQVLSGPTLSLARLRYMDAILGSVRQGGFTADLTDHAYHAIDSHIMGFTLWEIGITAGIARLPGSVEGFLETFDAEAYPYLAEHIDWHLREPSPDDEGEFAFGLRLILDGLERLRTTSP